MNKVLKLFKSKKLLLMVILVGVFVMSSFGIAQFAYAQNPVADFFNLIANPAAFAAQKLRGYRVMGFGVG